MERREVTFLLTEVVDSVRLWERDESDMVAATARLDAVVRSVVADHGGTQVKPRGEGDSHFLIFDEPTDAVACAVGLQRALADEPSLSLRSGCNVGIADLRDGDWYGTTVNRCARLRAAAHGRQSLVSAEVVSRIATSGRGLPVGITLHSLGRHRLKDLDEPVEVFQVRAGGLVDSHPPLATLNRSSGLPLPRTSLVGRRAELDRVSAALTSGAVVTVTGAPGVGTTRLALEAAAEWWEHDGRPVRLVTDPASWGAVASVRAEAGELVVADGAREWPPNAAPEGPAIVTGLAPFGGPGEIVVRLAPLDDLDAQYLLHDRLPPDQPLAPGLVAWCDGLPLAIELLARRASSVDPTVLAERLAADTLAVLGGDRRAEPPRHASLRAALRDAFGRLDPAARADLLAAPSGDPRWVAAGWHEHDGVLPLIARFLSDPEGGR